MKMISVIVFIVLKQLNVKRSLAIWLALILSMLSMRAHAQVQNVFEESAQQLNSQLVSQQILQNYKYFDIDRIKQRFSEMSNRVGTQWSEFADDIDQALVKRFNMQTQTTNNTSFLRLDIGQTWKESKALDTDVRLRARLDLPNTKHRWRLLLDNVDDFNQNIEDTTLNKTDSEKSIQTAALQWVLQQSDEWNLSATAGVRDLPLNPFLRFSINRSKDISDIHPNVLELINANITYSKEDTLFSNISYIWRYQEKQNSFWDSQLNLKWTDKNNEIEALTALYYEKKIDHNRRIKHGAGVILNNRPKIETKNYFIQSVFRQHLYADIVYWSVTPLLEFPREENFELIASINVKLSLYFKKQN